MHHLGDETAFQVAGKHSIEVDGKFFYTCVFPKIKENITQMATQNQLNSYQETSKEDFKSTTETTRISEYSMFEKHPNSPSQFNTFNKKSSRTCICTMLKN